MGCNHRWKKKKYSGISVDASWESCPICNAERNRNVKKLGNWKKKFKDEPWKHF